MPLSFEQRLEKYADLVIRGGLNLQAGQWLRLSAPIEAASFVRLLARKAYQAGSPYVHVQWGDSLLDLERVNHAPRDSASVYPQWEADGIEQMYASGAARLAIYSDDNSIFDNADQDFMATATRTSSLANKAGRAYILGNRINWTVISIPTPSWTRRVFPDLPLEEATAKFWEVIFEMCHVNNDDPVAAWRTHVAQLHARAEYMNARRYTTLHYTGGGTDLRLGLVEGHRWVGGGDTRQDGLPFSANIPTEEIFSAPDRWRVDGIVYGTKPSQYNGSVEDFWFKFEGGQVVDYGAKAGLAQLKALLETDEGSRRLGEVALVPHSSPIGRSGLLFHNGLYDENAACHIAFGAAYTACLPEAATMSSEDKAQRGFNESQVHHDMMIGSAAIDIDGILPDGSREPVLRSGEWAFDV